MTEEVSNKALRVNRHLYALGGGGGVTLTLARVFGSRACVPSSFSLRTAMVPPGIRILAASFHEVTAVPMIGILL